MNEKKALKLFGPRTGANKNLLVIELHTTWMTFNVLSRKYVNDINAYVKRKYLIINLLDKVLTKKFLRVYRG